MFVKICAIPGIYRVTDENKKEFQKDLYFNLNTLLQIEMDKNSFTFFYIIGDKVKQMTLFFEDIAITEYQKLKNIIDSKTIFSQETLAELVPATIAQDISDIEATMDMSQEELLTGNEAQNTSAIKATVGISQEEPPTKKIKKLGLSEAEREYLEKNLGLVEGKKILRKLGQGGMSIVYVAQNEDNELCVIKFLTNVIADPAPIKRFAQELRVSLRLDHPNIGRVFGFNKTLKDIWYLTMEYIRGLPLSVIIKDHKTIPCKTALQITIDIASALQHAWEKKIIHRDLKPENIMIEKKDLVVKIIDFGIAKIVGSSNLTMDNQILGTLRYMSPEQMMETKTVDYRSDIYSLGATLYHMLSGKPPYWNAGKDSTSIIVAISNKNLIPLEKITKDVPPLVIDIVEKAMNTDVENRYQNYEELIADLQKIYSRC